MEEAVGEACAKIDMARAIAPPPRGPLLVRAARAVRMNGAAHAARRAAEVLHLAAPPAAAPATKPAKRQWPARDDEHLGLRVGELVEVKSAEEILQTLDDEGRHRGLLFMSEMWKFCGGRHRVIRPVERLVAESTGWLRSGIKDTVLLENVNCDGTAHSGCDAYCYHMWREVWLRRPDDA